MADIPFAADIAQPDAATGGSIMFHVRGTTIDQFIRNLQDLQARVPQLQHVVAFNTATIREELTQEKATRKAVAKNVAAQRVEQAAAPLDTEPVCPEHGRSTPSRFGGLYCPENMGEAGFCKWKSSRAA